MKRKDFTVFRGCENTVPVNSITTTREEQKMEEEKRTHKGQHASMVKTLNIFVNQLSLSLSLFEYIENKYIYIYIYTLSCTSSIRISSLTSKLKT